MRVAQRAKREESNHVLSFSLSSISLSLSLGSAFLPSIYLPVYLCLCIYPCCVYLISPLYKRTDKFFFCMRFSVEEVIRKRRREKGPCRKKERIEMFIERVSRCGVLVSLRLLFLFFSWLKETDFSVPPAAPCCCGCRNFLTQKDQQQNENPQ